MAAHTSLLLVIALCAATAHSLKCYTCTAQLSNDKCLTAENCTSGETYCQTVVATATANGQSATAIDKRCVLSCKPESFNQGITYITRSCCTTDLCNYSGGATVRSSGAAILLALGSVLIILKSSVL